MIKAPVIRRNHSEGGIRSSALYSPCFAYRYALTRVWDDAKPRLLWIMLNPSTATELANDPTIHRCQLRGERMGFGAIRIANLFAYRATSPTDLKRAADPVGAANDKALDIALRWADAILPAWGVHGAHLGKGPDLLARLRRRRKPVLHLGLTKDGHPRHPLYVAYRDTPKPL